MTEDFFFNKFYEGIRSLNNPQVDIIAVDSIANLTTESFVVELSYDPCYDEESFPSLLMRINDEYFGFNEGFLRAKNASIDIILQRIKGVIL